MTLSQEMEANIDALEEGGNEGNLYSYRFKRAGLVQQTKVNNRPTTRGSVMLFSFVIVSERPYCHSQLLFIIIIF